MPNLSGSVQRAITIATRAGAGGLVLIERLAVPDVATGVQAAPIASQTINAVVDRAQIMRAAPGTLWASASVGLMLAAADCAFAPIIGDRATWGGVAYPIVARDVLAPTGTPIGYTLGLGGV